ncbi:retrotransposon protein, putative, ty1-copia subclass, partial [Tanacetum coccineum]
SARIPQAPERYGFYIDDEEHELGYHGEPPNYRAILSDPESEKWLEALNAEMQSMKDNQVWNLVDLPPNCKIVGSKWLFKKKTDMDGNIYTYKARLVAKGFTQTYGVDYEETSSPVADIKAIRILIDIIAYYDYNIWQMDVKTAFLNGRLNEDVYMVQPEGEAKRALVIWFLPCLILKIAREVVRMMYMHHESWWQSFGVLITLTVSWTYVTVIFLSSCLVFHLILEFVHDGDKSVAELMDIGRRLLGRRQVLPTVPHLIDSVQGNSAKPEGLHEIIRAGAMWLKLHEDWGTTLREGASNTKNTIDEHLDMLVGNLADPRHLEAIFSFSFFGEQTEMVIKGGDIAYANMGDPNASIPTPQPKLNDALPNIEVDPETYAVTADGVHLTCATATTVPLSRNNFLF